MEDKTTFVETFGESVLIRVLDFLLISRDFDYPIKQIAEEISANWVSTEQVILGLVKKEIVKETRIVGRSKRYALNKESKLAQYLMKIDFELSSMAIEEELKRQAQTVSIVEEV